GPPASNPDAGPSSQCDRQDPENQPAQAAIDGGLTFLLKLLKNNGLSYDGFTGPEPGHGFDLRLAMYHFMNKRLMIVAETVGLAPTLGFIERGIPFSQLTLVASDP
ncbi:MAG TPA: hypothetical protein VN794_23190, partial [Methylomirabilota bacterium]|nr:hypothetical protein [Methylomirabilota bacterium]